MTDGMKLEDLCVGYLQRVRECTETYYDEKNVRTKLQLPRGCSCADVLSLHQKEDMGVREITIAEAKAAGSAEPEKIGIQLGTAAAAALATFPKLERINLVVFTDRSRSASAAKDNPGLSIKIIADTSSLQSGRVMPLLMDVAANQRIRPSVDPKAGMQISRFAERIGALAIEIVVAGDISQQARKEHNITR